MKRIFEIARNVVNPIIHPYGNRLKNLEVQGVENVPENGPSIVISSYVDEIRDPMFIASALKSIGKTSVKHVRYPTANLGEKDIRTRIYNGLGSVEFYRRSDLAKIKDDGLRNSTLSQNTNALGKLEEHLANKGFVIIFPESKGTRGIDGMFRAGFFNWAAKLETKLNTKIDFLPTGINYNHGINVSFGEPTRYNGGGVRGLMDRCYEEIRKLSGY